MSFSHSIKRFFGFGGSEEDDENIYADTATNGEAPKDETKATDNKEPAQQLEPATFDPEMQQRIFAKVVEVFDASLPEFLAKSIDRDAQTKYLLEALDQDIRTYIDGLARNAEAYCEQRWQQKRSELNTELEAMRSRAGEIEKKSDDIRQKQLSADRQKRALSERVHDLETQLAKLEADREQYELENRSLVNRLKVVNVQQEDVDRLQAELNELRANPDAAAAKEVEALKAQIEQMTNGIDSIKEQSRISTEMVEEQRQRIAKATKELKEKTAEAEELGEQLKQKTIDANELSKLLDEKSKEVDELNELLKQYDEVNAKMEEIDRVLTAKEEKIKKQRSTIASRDAEIEKLRQTIADNLQIQNEREQQLQIQIDSLKGKPSDPTDDTEDSSPRISEADLTAIEESFESGEWFTNTPPAETPSMRVEEEAADFGYRKPKRKTPPVNDAQLSLF